MSIFGKIGGAGLGFALGGPLGALIGVAAGHAVDVAIQQLLPSDRAVIFTAAIVALAAKMAKADGVVSPLETDAFDRLVQVEAGEKANVRRLFNLAQRDVAGYDAYAGQIAGLFADDPAMRAEVLEALFFITAADGVVHPAELAFLEDVAGILRIDGKTLAAIEARHIRSVRDPYVVLGLDPDASEEEIKATRRRLVAETHPDRMIARGVPADFLVLANDRLAKINAAYDQIAKERGLK